jgi:hypothetical protein
MEPTLRTSAIMPGFSIPWDAAADGNMFIMENLYQRAATTPSDIHEHVPVLNQLARQCGHITELGVRFGVSSVAFMRSVAVLCSYDIYIQPEAKALFDAAIAAGKSVSLTESSSLEVNNPTITDLLFIDTDHTYSLLKAELELWESKVKKFIVLHDTTTYAYQDQSLSLDALTRSPSMGQQGIWPAIEEFIASYQHWSIHARYENNDGLTVLTRRSLL